MRPNFLCDRQVGGFKPDVARRLFVDILPLPNHSFDSRRKGFQMAIYAGIAFGMVYVYGISKAIVAHRDVRHVPITNREDGLSLHSIGLYVHSAMKMVGARFAKVTRQRDGIVYRRAKKHIGRQHYR